MFPNIRVKFKKNNTYIVVGPGLFNYCTKEKSFFDHKQGLYQEFYFWSLKPTINLPGIGKLLVNCKGDIILTQLYILLCKRYKLAGIENAINKGFILTYNGWQWQVLWKGKEIQLLGEMECYLIIQGNSKDISNRIIRILEHQEELLFYPKHLTDIVDYLTIQYQDKIQLSQIDFVFLLKYTFSCDVANIIQEYYQPFPDDTLCYLKEYCSLLKDKIFPSSSINLGDYLNISLKSYTLIFRVKDEPNLPSKELSTYHTIFPNSLIEFITLLDNLRIEVLHPLIKRIAY